MTDVTDGAIAENTNEPTIESNDIQERLAARRLRIQRRLEAARRALLGDSQEVIEMEQLTRAQQQIETSRQRLTKLIRDGNELVTNIRVACDAREQMRRSEDEEARRVRKEKLEAEAKAAAERFEEITRKWDMALQKDIPQELQETLMLQKQACDAMIEEKNKLITDLQNELRNKDDVYVRDMKKHTEDIDLLVERMEEEVRQVWKAYREELNEIERAYTEQRRETFEKYREDWEKLAQLRRQKEIEYLELKLKRIEDNEAHLHQIRVQDAEEYSILKIKLETEVQQLEQQLQQMKATYQLNQEKLEYNFQVLKKRDEENAITKNQQKRKITKLHDILNLQRQKLVKQEKQFKDENAQLLSEYKRVIEQLLDLQRKSRHFLESDQQMFREVWCLNEEEAKRLAKRLLEIDRILYDQQLGLEWDLLKKKSFEFLQNVGPIVSSKTVAQEKAVSAHEVMKEAFENVKDGRSSLVKQLSPDTVKRVLELLCDESGFLVETKLWTLLQPLDRTKQSLMRLDSVFQALGIETEEDIRKLTQYFIVNGGSDLLALSDDGRQLVHPNDALRVLLQFINDNRHLTSKMTDEDLDLEELFIRPHEHVFHIAKTEDRDNSEDALYWQKYGEILPEERVKVWNALEEALESYHELLGSRTSLLKETAELQQQNTELKMLLHQYLNARVNKEMQVPPTRVFASTHIQQQQQQNAAAKQANAE